MSAYYLPAEIRHMVLKALVEDCCNLARFATVSREWQEVIEQHTFARIRLTPPRIAELDIMTSRNRSRVRYLWFCLELERYDCPACDPVAEVVVSTSAKDDRIITTGIQDLFSVLSTWEPVICLSLDISVYSTSDSEHWFKHLTLRSDSLPDSHDQGVRGTVLSEANDDEHRWENSIGLLWPQAAIENVFVQIMGRSFVGDYDDDEDHIDDNTQWWRELPPVPAVTRLLIRQQSRRRWNPQSLVDMLGRLPRVREFHYEPWREWDDSAQESTDECNLILLESPALKGLTSLTIFENFSQQYVKAYFPHDCSRIRAPNPELSRALAKSSRNFESLAGSFMVDASDFFTFNEYQKWSNIKTLVLTSQLLAPDKSPASIMDMFQAAASVVMNMPQLKTMEIWNGRQKLAALFRYEHREGGQSSMVTWRGTWNLILTPHVIQAWEAVSIRRSGHGVKVVYEDLDGDRIMSHGDAILMLKLPEIVIRSVSLQQIREEEGIPLVPVSSD